MLSIKRYIGQKKEENNNFDIALLLCPCFTIGSPPLGLGYIQSVLRQKGYATLPFDLDFLLIRNNPKLFHEFYAIYNIGNLEDIDLVQYVLRPHFTLIALFQEHFPDSSKDKYAAELAVINKIEEYLCKYADDILSFGVSVAMFSVYISNLLPSLLLAKQLKKLNPSVKIIFGGPEVGLPEVQDFALRLGWVDVCITGEGEKNVSLIADAVFSGKSVNGIPGVSLIENSKVLSWPEAPSLDQNNLPIPDFTNFPCIGHKIRDYRSNPQLKIKWPTIALPIASTRGCIMRCAFCSESQYWKKFRQRNVENVIDEIEAQKERWGIKQFQFCDSLLNGKREWIEEFSDKIIERGIDVEFVWAFFRPTQLSRHILDKLARAGFRLIYYGMESGSQEVLDLMGKGTEVEEIKQVIKDTLRCGIYADITMLCGFPGESRKNFYESLFFYHNLISEIAHELGDEYVKRLSVGAGSIVRVEPYSELFKNAEKYGIRFKVKPMKLPPVLHHLGEYIEKLSMRWESDISVEEKIFRSSVLNSYANKELAIMYKKNSEIFCINDKTVFSKFNDDIYILVSSFSSNTYYLVRNRIVLAEVNALTLKVWQLIDGSRTIGEIKERISIENGIKNIDTKIKKVFEQFLSERLVYFNDF